MLRPSTRSGGLMQRYAGAVDHVIPKDDAVFNFGPEMKPVLEVDPGEVVTFETHDCFSGQIKTEGDLVTELDFDLVNPATGPVSVRGAEPGDSLIVEILDIRPGPQGVATIIPGYGQLIDFVESPVTKVLPVREGASTSATRSGSRPGRWSVSSGWPRAGRRSSTPCLANTAATSTTTFTG